MLSSEELRDRLSYNAESGQFDWKKRPAGSRRARVGSISSDKRRPSKPKYLVIAIDGKKYFAHRLAWLHVYGEWPSGEVDHVNGDGLDNRIANLRSATRGQNAANALAQSSNKAGLRGVFFQKHSGRYRAQITKQGKCFSLGYFDTPEDAHEAYLRAAAKLHGPFVRERPRSIAGAIAFRSG